MQPKRGIFAMALVTALTAGCASGTKDIKPQYVSPMVYRDYSCDELTDEMDRASRRVSALGGSIDKNAKQDKVATGVGIILFWPALFFIDGDSPEAAEYARLTGEYEAMEQAYTQKKCRFAMESAPATPTGTTAQ